MPSATVRVRQRYRHPVGKVYEAWLTPVQAARFLFATPTGSVLHCEIEPVVGGFFRVTDRRPHADADESFFEAEHRGTYIALEPPHRIVFDFWVEPFAEQRSRVTLDFRESGTSECELVLTHEMGEVVVDVADLERARSGWARTLELLDKVLGTRSWGLRSF